MIVFSCSNPSISYSKKLMIRLGHIPEMELGSG
jgi:hypothetical protein